MGHYVTLFYILTYATETLVSRDVWYENQLKSDWFLWIITGVFTVEGMQGGVTRRIS